MVDVTDTQATEKIGAKGVHELRVAFMHAGVTGVPVQLVDA